jgi:anti-sigma B factor antagonist
MAQRRGHGQETRSPAGDPSETVWWARTPEPEMARALPERQLRALPPGVGDPLSPAAALGPMPFRQRAPEEGIVPSRLALRHWSAGSTAVLSVTGEVDVASARELSRALVTALASSSTGLVADLTGVTFLGAAGLAALLCAEQRAGARQAQFDLVCPQAELRRVITLAGLESTFRVHHTVAEAVTAQADRAAGVRADPLVRTLASKGGDGSRRELGLSTGWMHPDSEESYEAKEAR